MERRDAVLERMFQLHMLDEDQFAAARTEALVLGSPQHMRRREAPYAIQAATANARYDLISTLPALDRARAAVPSLFPAWPERIPELQAWSSRHGEPLIQRLEAVETALAALGAQPADDAGQGVRITLLELRDALLSFRDDPAVDGAATVREALDWAGSIARRSIEEHRDAWDAARRDLAHGVVGDQLVSRVIAG